MQANDELDSTESNNVWEQSKENILPLARGRNIADLQKSLGLEYKTTNSDQNAILQRIKREFEKEISSYNGDDPLKLWFEYIRTLRDNCPTDQSEQFSVIEKSARIFRNEEKYKEDPRYLQIWILYASLLSNADDLFKFLYKNEIGIRQSLFWISWAWVAETNKNYDFVEKLFLKGEDYAVDSTIIKSRHAQFIRRARSLWSRTASTEAPEVSLQTSFAIDAPLREILSELTKAAIEQNDRIPQHHSNMADRPSSSRIGALGGRKGLTCTVRTQEGILSERPNKASFAIFDESVFIGENTSKDEFDILDAAAPWDDFGTRSDREKENVMVAKAWTKSALPSSKGYQPQRIDEGIDVYVDEAFREGQPTIEEPITLAAGAIIGKHNVELSDMKGLPECAFQNSISSQLRPKFSFKGIEIMPGENCREEEMQFEEMRAMNKKYALKHDLLESATAVSLPLLEPMIQAPGKSFPELVSRHANNSIIAHNSSNYLGFDCGEDITVHTKAALEDVDCMFSSPKFDFCSILNSTKKEMNEGVSDCLFSCEKDNFDFCLFNDNFEHQSSKEKNHDHLIFKKKEKGEYNERQLQDLYGSPLQFEVLHEKHIEPLKEYQYKNEFSGVKLQFSDENQDIDNQSGAMGCLNVDENSTVETSRASIRPKGMRKAFGVSTAEAPRKITNRQIIQDLEISSTRAMNLSTMGFDSTVDQIKDEFNQIQQPSTRLKNGPSIKDMEKSIFDDEGQIFDESQQYSEEVITGSLDKFGERNFGLTIYDDSDSGSNDKFDFVIYDDSESDEQQIVKDHTTKFNYSITEDIAMQDFSEPSLRGGNKNIAPKHLRSSSIIRENISSA